MRDRLSLGVALLALVVGVAALVVAVDNAGDGGSDAAATTTTAAVPAVVPATTVAVPAVSPTTTDLLIVTPTTAELPDPPLLLSVVGVSYGSSLNVRDEPGGDIISELGSTAVGIVPTGEVREAADMVWHEVLAGGVTGWVSSDYVSPMGTATDVTADLAARLGEAPSASNMSDLGREVAAAYAATEPESRVRIAGEPTVGDPSEVTVDVVGQPDDSIRGFRLRVLATRSGGQFTAISVQSTPMCYIDRGVSALGLCN